MVTPPDAARLGAEAASLAFNFVCANAIILANKEVFVGAQFRFPGALTLIHYVFTWACGLVLLQANLYSPKKMEARGKWVLRALVVIWALANGVSNSSLEKNSIGFYQMMKLLVTPTVVLLDYGCYGKTISLQRCLALVVASGGVALATVSDVQFNVSGAWTSLLAVLLGALHKMLTAHVQQHLGYSSLQMMHYGLPRMIVLSAAILPLLDPPGLLEYEWTGYRAGAVVVSGLVGFAINFSMSLALGHTSALTVVLLGQFKTVSVVLFGYLLYDAAPNLRTLLGAAIAIVAITAYTLLNLRERQARPVAKKNASDVNLADAAVPPR